jgi:predicted nucleotidyltransferase
MDADGRFRLARTPGVISTSYDPTHFCFRPHLVMRNGKSKADLIGPSDRSQNESGPPSGFGLEVWVPPQRAVARIHDPGAAVQSVRARATSVSRHNHQSTVLAGAIAAHLRRHDRFMRLGHGASRATVFGSIASRRARETSDVDVAVLFADEPAPATLDRLTEDLEDATGRSVDLVDLTTASPLLAHQIVSKARAC